MATAPAARTPDRRLGLTELLDALLADGLISGSQRKDAAVKVDAVRDKRHPLDIIASLDWPDPRKAGAKLTMDVLTQWLAARHNIGWMRIDPLSIDVAKVTAVMPYAYAARVRVLPVKVTPTEITVATAEPLEREWETELARIIPQAIKRVVASPGEIERYLVEFYALARSVKASNEERRLLPTGSQNLEQLMELGRKGKLTADDQHVVAIVDWLLSYAFDSRASDIHLEPRRDSSLVRFRIDGVLHEVYQMPTPVMIAVTSRIKILSRMDVAEKRKPQDGRIKTRSPNGKEVELRASSLPTAFGEKLVMRIFDPEVLVRDFAQLGFSESDSDRWNDMIRAPHGIILVTGPTGSGKTTTLYTSLKQLATSEVNVCTIEDPIELVEPSFNQMQVQAGIDLTFASGVRAAAPGPRHHHDRRDPRPRDRGDRDPGRAHGSPGVVDLAHQRCAERDHAPARPGRAALPDQGDPARRGRAAPRATPVPALQAALGARPGGMGRARGHRQARADAGRGASAGGLSRVPRDGPPRTARPVRDHAADRGRQAPDRSPDRHRGPASPGAARRHGAAARGRRREDRRGADRHRRSARRNAGGVARLTRGP